MMSSKSGLKVGSAERRQLDEIAANVSEVFDLIKLPPSYNPDNNEYRELIGAAIPRLTTALEDIRDLGDRLSIDFQPEESRVQDEVWNLVSQLRLPDSRSQASWIFNQVISAIEEVGTGRYRTPGFLERSGIEVAELASLYPVHRLEDLHKIPLSLFQRVYGCGQKSMSEISYVLEQSGITLNR